MHGEHSEREQGAPTVLTETCQTCMGSGRVAFLSRVCPECYGSGKVLARTAWSKTTVSLQQKPDGSGHVTEDKPCPMCGGSGMTDDCYANPCPNCDGTGRVITRKDFPVEDILDEAKRITSGDRNAQYGPPERNLGNIAAMWTVIFGTPVTARQVGLAMIAMKVCREVHAPHRDNLTDCAGYARITSLLP